jgi:uncharacterized protein YjeT (DUF2065 family)
MNSLSVFCIVLGTWVIAKRAPLVFAPRRTLRAYDRWVLATTTRMRAFGIAIAIFGITLVFLPLGDAGLARLLHSVGVAMLAVALSVLVLPKWTQRQVRRLVAFVELSVGDRGLRVIGLLSVALGVFLIYLGISVA